MSSVESDADTGASTRPLGDQQRRRRRRLIAFGIAGLVALIGYRPALEVGRVTIPIHRPVAAPAAELGLSVENVAFTSDDGVKLTGWYVPPKNGATILLLHGFGSTRAGMTAHAAMLSKAGFGVLAYDLRGHGESGGRIRSFGWRDIEDVGAAIRYLGTRAEVDVSRLGVLGFSVGGNLAVRAGARFPGVRAVVADAPAGVVAHDAPPPHSLAERYDRFQAELVDVGVAVVSLTAPPPGLTDELPRLSPKPVLYVSTGGENDGHVSAYRFGFAHEPHKFLRLPSPTHVSGLSVDRATYEREVVEHFALATGAKPAAPAPTPATP